MKKQLQQLLLVAALLLPWMTQAQTTITLPWTHDFESDAAGTNAELPSGWTRINHASTYNYYPYIYSSTTYAHNSSKCLYFYMATTATYANNAYMSLPAIANGHDMQNVRVRFYAKRSINAAQLYVGVMSNPSQASTFVPVDTITLEPAHQCYTVSLARYTGTGRHLAFYMKKNTVATYCGIDDIEIYEAGCHEVPDSLQATPLSETSVRLSWHDGGTAPSSWTVFYAPATSTGTPDSMVVTTNPATLTGLTNATTYQFTVAANCFDGSRTLTSVPTSVFTPCYPIPADSLPYVYGFEDATASGTSGTFDPCYRRGVVGISTAWPYPIATQHSGTYGCYFYNTAGNGIYSWLAMPRFESPMNTLQVSFWGYKTSANYGHLVIGVMSNPDDFSTFVGVDTIQVSGVNTWEYFEVPLTSYTGTGRFLAFAACAGVINYFYLDDLTVDVLPTCPRPTNLAVGNVTPHSFDLTWHSDALAYEYEVEYGRAGFIQGQGETVTVYDTVAQFSDLLLGTTYDCYVRAICGSDDTSTWSLGSFATGCDSLRPSDLPYSDDFEAYGSGSSFPISSCWHRINNYPYPNSTAAINGARGLYFYGYTTSSYSFVTLPAVSDSVPINTLQLEFMAKRYSSTGTNYHSKLIVGVATSPSSTTGFHPIDTVDLDAAPANSIHSIEVQFSGYTGNGRYIALYVPTPGASQYNYIYVDDVVVRRIPTCYRPAAARVTDITSDEATLVWTPDARTTVPSGGFEVEYGLHGFRRGSGSFEYSTDTTVTLYNLNPSMEYDAYIVASCGSETSDPRMITFRTACTPIPTDSLPYIENFDSYPAGTSATAGQTIDPCWRKGTNAATAYPYLYTTASSSSPNSMYFYATNLYYSYVALPLFEADINQLVLSFELSKTSANYGHMRVGVMTSPSDISTFTTLGHAWPTELNTWERFEFSFPDYYGDGRYLALLLPDSATSNVRLDNVSVTALLNCPTVQNAVVTMVASDSVTIAWDNDTLVSMWDVYYGHPGFSLDTMPFMSVAAPTITLYGLTPNTDYEYVIVASCNGDRSNPTFPATFRTACTTIPTDSLPYVENFDRYPASTSIADGQTLNDCWKKGTNYSSEYPYVYSGYAVSQANCLRFYTSTEYYCYAALPAFVAPITSLRVNFDLYRHSVSYTGKVTVGVMTDPTDITTFTPVDTCYPAVPAGYHASFEVLLEGYTGSGRYIAFKANNDSLNYVNLDNVMVSLIPACRRSIGLQSTNVTTTTADLQWQYNGNNLPASYTVAYSRQPGFLPDTCHSVLTVADSHATLTTLLPYTRYYWAVRTNCGADTGDWSDIASFLTSIDCGAGSILVEDTVGTGLNSSYSYGMYCYSTYPSGYSRSIFTTQELADMGITQNNTLRALSLHSGSVEGTINNVSIYLVETDLDVFGSSPASDTVAPANMTRVFHGNLTIPANSWVEIPFDTVFPFSGNRNIMVTLARNGSASGSIAFYYTSTSPNYRVCYGYRSSSTATHNTAYRTYYRPDMAFRICAEVPRCERPSDVALAALLHNRATVTWSGDAPRYEVAYGPTGFNPDTVASLAGTHVVVNNDTAYTLTGLTPHTGYDVYVRTLCSTGDTSVWSVALSFTTPCAPQLLPFTENFESYASGATVSLNGCWVKGTNNSTAYPYPYSTNAVDGVRSLYFYAYNASSTEYYCYAALPLMNAPVDSLMLTFKMRRYATVSDLYTTRVVVGVMIDPADIGTFTPVDTIDLRDEEPSAVSHVTVLFNNYHGAGNFIAIYDEVPPLYGTGASCYSYAYVDDIRVDYLPTCLPVANVTVPDSTVTAATAVVDWVDRVVPAAGYELEYGPQGFTLGTGTVVSSATRPATLTGLTSGTRYDVYVRALCSATDTAPWSAAAHFTTVCTPKPLPYTEGFEAYGTGAAYAIDPCWTKGTNNSTAYPYPYATSAITGTRSLYFYAYRPSSTTSTAYYCYAALPLMAAPVDSLQLTFSMRRYNSTSNYYTSRLVVGLMTDPANIATFSPVDTIDLFNEAGNSVHGVEVSFAGHGNQGQYIALYDEVPPLYGGSTYTYSYAYVDDIFVDRIPTCAAPADVTVPDSSVAATSAVVRWTDRTASPLGYELKYLPQGSTQASVAVSATQPATLTGLTPGTDYEVYVRAICSASDTSVWSFPVTFTTRCQPLATLPVTYDLEGLPTGSGARVPVCWNRLNNGTTYGYYPFVQNGAANAHSGSNFLYWYTTTTATTYGDYGIMVLPEVDTATYAARTWEMSFWGKGYSSGSYDHRIMVGVMTDPEDPATFVGVDTLTLATGTYTEYRVSFANYTGHGTYPAFRKNRGTTTGYAYIDDITLMQSTACPRPYHLRALASTATTATLAWQDTIGATAWELAYRTDDDTVDHTVTVTANPFVLTGLAPATNYQFWVAAHCPGSTQTGDYSIGVARFATSQVPDTVPAYYDFETAGEWAAWQTVGNTVVNWYRGSVPYADNSRHALYLSADSGATRSTDMNSTVNACAYRDIDFGPDTGGFAVSFRVNVGGTQSHNYDGLSVLLVDPSTVVEPSAATLTSPWGHVNNISLGTFRRTNGWTTATVYLDRVSGVKRLAFYWFNQATGSADFTGLPPAIDSVVVYAQECPRPSGLAAVPASITSSTAMVQWEGPATGTEYVVAYREVGAAASTNRYDTVTTNHLMLTGLADNTGYNFWVRRLCDNTHSSAYSDNCTFYTLCNMFVAYDTLRENFDLVPAVEWNATGGQLPDCWGGYSNGTDSKYMPHVTDGNSYSYTASGTHAITMTSGTAAYGDTKIVRLPRFVEPVSSLTLSYWMCTEGSTQGTLSVGYMTGFDYETDFVPVKSIPASAATQHSGTGLQTGHGLRDTVTFDSVPANAIYVAFRWTHNASFYSCCIDDVEVTSDISCASPVIVSTSHDYESVTLTWAGSVDNYDVALTAGAWNPAMVPTATGLTGTSYRFAGLQPSTSYTVGVRQHCDSTDVSLWSTVVVVTDSLPCLPPDSLTALNVTNNTATFGWTPRGAETAWDLRVYNSTFDTVCTVTAATATVGGLTAGVTYYAAVRALCGTAQNIEGSWSDSITFTTQTCPTVTGVVASNVTFNSVTLAWTAVNNARNYEVEYGVSGFTQGNGTTMTVAMNGLTVTGLPAETAYDFYVRAICGTDWLSESWSPVVTVTTLSSPVDSSAALVVSFDGDRGYVLINGAEAGSYYGLLGDEVSLEAVPREGYRFVDWSDGETAALRTFVLEQSTTTLAATFEVDGAEGIATVEGNVSCLIRPNPATRSTTVSVSGANGKVRITVIDINGREVKREEVSTFNAQLSTTIDVDNLAQGAYFVRITGENVQMVKRLIVR